MDRDAVRRRERVPHRGAGGLGKVARCRAPVGGRAPSKSNGVRDDGRHRNRAAPTPPLARSPPQRPDRGRERCHQRVNGRARCHLSSEARRSLLQARYKSQSDVTFALLDVNYTCRLLIELIGRLTGWGDHGLADRALASSSAAVYAESPIEGVLPGPLQQFLSSSTTSPTHSSPAGRPACRRSARALRDCPSGDRQRAPSGVRHALHSPRPPTTSSNRVGLQAPRPTRSLAVPGVPTRSTVARPFGARPADEPKDRHGPIRSAPSVPRAHEEPAELRDRPACQSGSPRTRPQAPGMLRLFQYLFYDPSPTRPLPGSLPNTGVASHNASVCWPAVGVPIRAPAEPTRQPAVPRPPAKSPTPLHRSARARAIGTKSAKQMIQGGTMIVNTLKAVIETGRPSLGTRALFALFRVMQPFTPKRRPNHDSVPTRYGDSVLPRTNGVSWLKSRRPCGRAASRPWQPRPRPSQRTRGPTAAWS